MLFVKLLVVLRYQQSVCVVLKIHVLNINVAAVVSLQEFFCFVIFSSLLLAAMSVMRCSHVFLPVHTNCNSLNSFRVLE